MTRAQREGGTDKRRKQGGFAEARTQLYRRQFGRVLLKMVSSRSMHMPVCSCEFVMGTAQLC